MLPMRQCISYVKLVMTSELKSEIPTVACSTERIHTDIICKHHSLPVVDSSTCNTMYNSQFTTTGVLILLVLCK